MRVLTDTNVLIDFMAMRKPHEAYAVKPRYFLHSPKSCSCVGEKGNATIFMRDF